MTIEIAHDMLGQFISIEFDREAGNPRPPRATLTIKSNIGVSDHGPKSGDGKMGGAPTDLAQKGDQLMAKLEKLLGAAGLPVDERPAAAIPDGEEAEHASSAFIFKRGVTVGGRSDAEVRRIVEAAISTAKKQMGNETFGRTSDEEAGRMGGAGG